MQKKRILAEQTTRELIRVGIVIARDPTVNIRVARTQFSRLVTRAERGERVTITRRGKPVAILQAARQAKTAVLPRRVWKRPTRRL